MLMSQWLVERCIGGIIIGRKVESCQGSYGAIDSLGDNVSCGYPEYSTHY